MLVGHCLISFLLERERVDRILAKVSAETGFPIVQKHGQRIYGGPPPNWTGPVPERGTELYCYRIPRDCYEVSKDWTKKIYDQSLRKHFFFTKFSIL